jgi:hypothetical protein
VELISYTSQTGFQLQILAETRGTAAIADRLAWAASRWRLRASLRRAGLIDGADARAAARRRPGR